MMESQIWWQRIKTEACLWYLGKGDGTFQDRVDYSIYESPASALDAVAADFDGDGNVDIAIVNSATNAVLIAFGNGDGTLQPQTAVNTQRCKRRVHA